MPGVHEAAAPASLLQLAPMLPPDGAQFEPLQQTPGLGGGCGVHIKPGAQPPMESQRQPCWPTRHVEGPPEPELPPPPDPELPEDAPELDVPPLLADPKAPDDAPELDAPPLPDPEVPEEAPELAPPLPLPELPPHAAITVKTGMASASEPTSERGNCIVIMFSSR